MPASKDEYLDRRREQLVEDIYSKMETHPGARVSHVELAPEKPTPRSPGPEKRDYHGTPLVAPECDAMREVEGLLGKPVPEGARRVAWNTFGFAAEGGHVTVLGLFEQGLSSLPVTIGNLSSLKELYLYNNELSSLPETIGKLSSLQRLDLDRNPLSSLPETVKRALKEMKKRGCKIEGIKI